jgi:hypothetical protein
MSCASAAVTDGRRASSMSQGAIMGEAREVFRCAGSLWFAFLLSTFAIPSASAQAGSTCDLVPLAVRPDPGPEFVVGCTEYVLKYGGGSGTQGSYAPLDLPDCAEDPCGDGGSNRYRCELMNGYACCVDSGQCIPAAAGNLAGPTAQSIAYRFAADFDQREGICFAQYNGNGQRIITVLMTGPPQGGGSGPCYVVLRYGEFFLTRIPGAGNESLIFANFLGYASARPTPARAPTWAEVKRLYQ